jgi:MFS family permease
MAESPPNPPDDINKNIDKHADSQLTELPNSWKYKKMKLGPFTLPWYASPPTQLFIVSIVCFMCPGMFNALSGMGGGGQIDQGPSNDANTALYSTFAVVGFFAGSFCNVLGLRLTLAIGGTGYCIYVASFLSYSHNHNYGFTVFAGAFLGVCAGLLWTAQGSIMMSYPSEKSKGRYISWFWMIFNLGAVIGALIPLGQNIHAKTKVTVSDGTYIGFLILTLIGAGLALTLANAKDIIRSDGSRVILMKNPTWKSEFSGLVNVFISDPYIVFLFPMFFASNFFYGYQFNAVNGRKFNTRTAALNNVLYWSMQIVGAYIFGYCLDYQGIRRSIKARLVWVALLAFTMAVWGGGYAFQKTYTREEVDPALVPDPPVYDWTTPGYIGPMFLYMFYGVYDAAFQTSVYW